MIGLLAFTLLGASKSYADLPPVKNEAGLEVTPGYLMIQPGVSQEDVFRDFPNINTDTSAQKFLIKNIKLPGGSATKVTYEYVDDEGNTITPKVKDYRIGFRWQKIKVTESSTNSSVTFECPNSIFPENYGMRGRPMDAPNFDFGGVSQNMVENCTILDINKTYGLKKEHPEELTDYLTQAFNIKAWHLTDGSPYTYQKDGIATLAFNPLINSSVTTVDFNQVSSGVVAIGILNTSTGKLGKTSSQKGAVFGAQIKDLRLDTPSYVVVEKGENLNLAKDETTNNETVLKKLFIGKYQSLTNVTAPQTSSKDLKFEWFKPGTDETTQVDTDTLGFKQQNVRITDRKFTDAYTENPLNFYVVDHKEDLMMVPKTDINLEGVKGSENTSGMIMTASEVASKSSEELTQFIRDKKPYAPINISTGDRGEATLETVDVPVNLRGDYTLTWQIKMANEEKPFEYHEALSVVPDEVFGDGSTKGWESIPEGIDKTENTIINPINESRIGFPGKGMPILGNGSKDSPYVKKGFVAVDKQGNKYIYGTNRGQQVSIVPGQSAPDSEDGQFQDPIYNFNNSKKGYWYRENGIMYGTSTNEEFMSKVLGKAHYLKKGNQLKQVITTKDNNFVYSYDLSLNRNLNFDMSFSIYNTNEMKSSKYLSAMEGVDTSYGKDTVAIKSLANNSGFYLETDDNRRFTVKLKDGSNHWLSDYKKYKVGYFGRNEQNSGGYTVLDLVSGNNYFTDQYGTFNKLGDESRKLNTNLNKGLILVDGVDSAYEIGAPPKKIKYDQALKVGYQLFAGDELPYMKMATTPPQFDYYYDDERLQKDFDYNYVLSKIPDSGDGPLGTIYFTYPDGSKKEVPYTSDKTLTFSGKDTISKSTLPSKDKLIVNTPNGDLKTYSTEILAIHNVGHYKFLPSEDYTLPINVYKLGADPIPQFIKKGTKFTKSAKDIVRNPIILPKHEAQYDYVSELPDTSVEGVTKVKVKMTDKDQPEQTEVIEVPVIVSENPMTKGIYLTAKDFKTFPEDVSKLKDDEALEEFIVNRSEAIAVDAATLSSDNIQIKVLDTNLKTDSPVGDYTATLQASKDGQKSDLKKINIHVDQGLVDLSFQQRYKEDPTKPIYSDYKTEKLVDNSSNQYPVKAGEPIQEVIDKMLEDHSKDFTLNYPGYKPLKSTDYKILVNGEEQKTDKVPDKPFTVTYLYDGVMEVEAQNLYYGPSKITHEKEERIENSNSPITVTVVNTTLNPKVQAMVSLPSEITKDKDAFKGTLQVDSDELKDKDKVITKEGTLFKDYSKEPLKPFDTISLKVEAIQTKGNTRGIYRGKLDWSLKAVSD